MFTAELIEYVKSVVTYYTVFLLIMPGLGLLYIRKLSRFSEEYPVESQIARIGVFIYMITGVGLIFVKVFTNI